MEDEQFFASGRVIRILQSSKTNTAHHCQVLFQCVTSLARVNHIANKITWPQPKYIAIWDNDVISTLSPLWKQHLCVSATKQYVSLDGPEGRAQQHLGAPWVQNKGRGGQVLVFRAMFVVRPPVQTIDTLALKHLRPMFPPASRAGLGSRWTAQATMSSLMHLVRQVTNDVTGPFLQIRDLFVPYVFIALAAFIRPSSARSMTYAEALGLVLYITDTGGPDHGISACRVVDLLVHMPDLAGMPLPHYKLVPQRIPDLQTLNSVPDELGPDQVRAGLAKSRSLPTPTRPLLVVRTTDKGKDQSTITVSGYDMAVARILQPPGSRAVLFSWCGNIRSAEAAAHVRLCLDSVSEADCIIVAPNDAMALALRERGLPVHGLTDALHGRVGMSPTLVVVEAHVLGARTLARLCCMVIDMDSDARTSGVSLVLIGDPHYSLGAADGHDGGAPFRDAWASQVIERGLGGSHAFGPFGRVLPGMAHTAALMDNRTADLVVASCVYNANTAIDAPPITAETLVLKAGYPAPRPEGEDVWDKTSAQFDAGDWVVFSDTGERRRIESLGRLEGDQFIRLKGPFWANDLDVAMRLLPASEPVRDHRLCCGTPNSLTVRLSVHVRHITKANAMQVRVAGAVFSHPVARHVHLSLADANAKLSLDDIRVAAKLAGESLTIDYGGETGSEAEALATRARGRARSALFDLIRGPEEAFAAQADEIIGRMQKQCQRDVMSLETTESLSIFVADAGPSNEHGGGGGNDAGENENDRAVMPAEGGGLPLPPPPEAVRAMTIPDFEQAVRDRLGALLDAVSLCNKSETDGLIARRYPFSMRALLPAIRATALTDMALRERIALAVACKVCRGIPILEAWLVRSEAALAQVRGASNAEAHATAVKTYMATLAPIEQSWQQEDNETEMTRAIKNIQTYLLETVQ